MAGDPLAGARRVAGVEVTGRVDALERLGREERWCRDVVFLPQVVEARPRSCRIIAGRADSRERKE